MKIYIESFGKKWKLTTAAGESSYVEKIPTSGQVVSFNGPNGKVNRMIGQLSTR